MRTVLGLTLPQWMLANFAVSAYMTGVIWFVQLVHYPLLAMVGPDQFVAYERQHTRRTGWVVGAPMVFELVAAVLFTYIASATFFFTSAVFCLALVVVIWLSTFALQVPCHNRLEARFDEVTCSRLVKTNWIRTVAWTLRTLFLAAMLVRLLKLLTSGKL